MDWKRGLGTIHSSMYSTPAMSKPSNSRLLRLFNTHTKRKPNSNNEIEIRPLKQYIDLYPAVYLDNTQLYGICYSNDEALSKMEVVETHTSSGKCVLMNKWQEAYYPFCNDIHALDMKNLDDDGMGRRIG